MQNNIRRAIIVYCSRVGRTFRPSTPPVTLLLLLRSHISSFLVSGVGRHTTEGARSRQSTNFRAPQGGQALSTGKDIGSVTPEPSRHSRQLYISVPAIPCLDSRRLVQHALPKRFQTAHDTTTRAAAVCSACSPPPPRRRRRRRRRQTLKKRRRPWGWRWERRL